MSRNYFEAKALSAADVRTALYSLNGLKHFSDYIFLQSSAGGYSIVDMLGNAKTIKSLVSATSNGKDVLSAYTLK